MERRYYEPEAERYFSDKIDFEGYFNSFGKLVADAFPGDGINHVLGLPEMSEALKYMDICTDKLFPPKSAHTDENPLPKGFTYDVREIPESVTNLKSLQMVRSRSKQEIKQLKRKLFYSGEVDLEDTIREQTNVDLMDLSPYSFYVFSVRVYIPVAHSKYAIQFRTRDLQVSQEFLCLSSTGLDALRDRIACTNDFQPADGDTSLCYPSRRTHTRTGDIHRSALFYFGNDFFVDAREPDNLDYSYPLIKWGKDNGYEFGNVFKMEQSTMAELADIRLGYPYVYMHQGSCEHIVIFTDARLLHIVDNLDSTKYPIMIGFASLNSRYCFTCHVRMAKYLVVESDRLPEDAAFVCTVCLESFNYKQGHKIGKFKLYAYVDRAALL